MRFEEIQESAQPPVHAPSQAALSSPPATQTAAGAVPAVGNSTQGFWPSFVQISSGSLVWALLLAAALVRWRSRLDRIMDAIAAHIESGKGFKLGPLEMSPTVIQDGFSKGTESSDSAPSKVSTIALPDGFSQLPIVQTPAAEKRVDLE